MALWEVPAAEVPPPDDPAGGAAGVAGACSVGDICDSDAQHAGWKNIRVHPSEKPACSLDRWPPPSDPVSSLDTGVGAVALAPDDAIRLRVCDFDISVDLNVKDAIGAREDRSLDGAGLRQSKKAGKAIRRAEAEAQRRGAVLTASPEHRRR